MTAYLKYYFRLLDDRLELDSLAVLAGEEPAEPENFLKWYEDGDLGPPLVPFEAFNRSDSPIYCAMFAPRRVNFSVEKFKKAKT